MVHSVHVWKKCSLNCWLVGFRNCYLSYLEHVSEWKCKVLTSQHTVFPQNFQVPLKTLQASLNFSEFSSNFTVFPSNFTFFPKRFFHKVYSLKMQFFPFLYKINSKTYIFSSQTLKVPSNVHKVYSIKFQFLQFPIYNQ